MYVTEIPRDYTPELVQELRQRIKTVKHPELLLFDLQQACLSDCTKGYAINIGDQLEGLNEVYAFSEAENISQLKNFGG